MSAKVLDDRNEPVEAGPVAEACPPPVERMFTLRTMLILGCVWVIALLYMGHYLKRGWVPHDDGTYAQSAERVLHGELPHRDFDGGYTGGLTLVDALALRVLGVNLASLRILLFAVFAVWVPCVFYVASRFVSSGTAGAVTFLCVAWSAPNYPAASPSWYNLFFAVFGIAAFLRYIETGGRRWLFIAGVFGGLSILAKITGVYFVAAAALFLVFREQSNATAKGPYALSNSLLFRLFVISSLTIFLIALTKLITNIPELGSLIYFVLPSAIVIGVLLSREFAEPRPPSWSRFRNLLSLSVPFAIGVALPIIIFLTPYALSHSTATLIGGLFRSTEKQIQVAAIAAPSPVFMLALLPISILIIVMLYSHREGRVVYGIFLLVYLGIVLILSSKSQLAYAHGWCSLAYAIPVITIASALLLRPAQIAPRLTASRQQQIMLVVAMMTLVSLVQFPFGVPVYFCYIAPVAILAALALFSSLHGLPRFALHSLIGFYTLFAVLWMAPNFSVGRVLRVVNVKNEQLTMARGGGLRVYATEAQIYNRLIPSIQSHARGDFIYAAPDCPEVYFLAGFQNPTRTFFDFFDDGVGRSERILRALQSHDVSVVAIDSQPQFSGPLAPDLMSDLERLYPSFEEIGHFQVRWR